MTEPDNQVVSFAKAAAMRGRTLKIGNPLISEVNAAGFSGIRVESLGKQVGQANLLADVTFEASPGSCFGILGENGSGKTTLLRLITGLAFPTAGAVTVSGKNPHTDTVGALGMISGLIGIPAFHPHMNAHDNLGLFWDGDSAADTQRIMGALHTVGLADEAEKKVGDYSRGMLQRLGVALVIMQDRPLVVLDEPTQGVDVVWAEKLSALFREMAEKGKLLLITSHDFDFITGLCGHVLILDGGRTAYQGRLKDIAEFPYYFHLRAEPSEKTLEVVKRLDFVHRAARVGEALELTLKAENTNMLVAELVAAGCQIHECALRHYSVADLIAQRRAKTA
ncbi:MAG: ABC transporter ATP-binding protein [Nitrospinae bacterium]|nr:ABC transporter ATP-binding protein [Nitrospinota bacterium]